MSGDYHGHHKPTLFWPSLLIGVGVLFLLSNLGIIQDINYFNLVRLWPLILIAVGLQIMFGRENPWLSNTIAVSIVLAAIAFVAFVPSTSLMPEISDELIQDYFEVPDDGVEIADVSIDIDYGDLEIQSLQDSKNIFEADMLYRGRVDFRDSGGLRKLIQLHLFEDDFSFLRSWFDTQGVNTTVGLSRFLPITLDVSQGSGVTMLDLHDVYIHSLEVNSGSGPVTVLMADGSYAANLETGSGSLTIEVPENTDLDMEATVGSGRLVLNLADDVSGDVQLESGSGGITINVPEDLGVQVSGSFGSGSVSVPRGFRALRSDDHGGIWKSTNFESAESQVYIEFDIGSGNLRISN